MKEKNNPGNIDFYALFFRYFIYWPWFLVSIGLCLAATYLYLQYQTPMYSIQSAILIKEQENKQQGNNPTLSAIQDLGMMTLTNNFDNELQILKSQTLVRKVVDDLGLYISQTEDRSFGYDLPLYRNEPVKVFTICTLHCIFPTVTGNSSKIYSLEKCPSFHFKVRSSS